MFPAGTAKAFVRVATRKRGPGDQVTLVGYGRTSGVIAEFGTSATIERRVGTNTLFDIAKYPNFVSELGKDVLTIAGPITTATAPAGRVNQAMITYGDGGGAMIAGDALLGIALFAATREGNAGLFLDFPADAVGVYVNLVSDAVVTGLAQAQKDGLVVTSEDTAPAAAVPDEDAGTENDAAVPPEAADDGCAS